MYVFSIHKYFKKGFNVLTLILTVIYQVKKHHIQHQYKRENIRTSVLASLDIMLPKLQCTLYLSSIGALYNVF